jgi:phage protein D
MSTLPAYAPEMRLELGGRPAPAELRGSVTAVSCQTGLGGSDRLEVTLANERLRWLDHPLLDLDSSVTFAAGYAPDEPTQLFSGEVTGTEAAFPSDGMPTLRVVAQDRRTRLAAASPERLFAIPIPKLGLTPLPDLIVAPFVALEHQLATYVDPVGSLLSAALFALDVVTGDPGQRQHLARKQHGQTTLAFLEKIAVDNGWEVLVDHGPLGQGQLIRLMSPAGELTHDVVLGYGRSLIDFSPRISKVGQVASVSVNVWRPEIKLELTVKVSYDWDKHALDIEITPGFLNKAKEAKAAAARAKAAAEKAKAAAAGGGDDDAPKKKEKEPPDKSKDGSETSAMIADEPVTLEGAPRLIISKLLPKLNKRLTATGSCVGNPEVTAGRVMRIEGVGETFGGLYRITQARHAFDGGGYRTSFDLRKEIWFGSIPKPAQGASRVIPIPLRAGT